MKLILLFLLLVAHVPIAWPCFKALRRKSVPRSIDIMGVAFIFYYDLEISWEAFGGRYEHLTFKPFFSGGDPLLVIAIVFLLSAPLILKIGYLMASIPELKPGHIQVKLSRPKIFYVAALVVSGAICAFVIYYLVSSAAIWTLRQDLARMLGPMVVIFYIPLSILGFYVRFPESRHGKGKTFVWVLFSLSTIAGIGSGERTFVLFPALILLLFWGRPSLRKLSLGSAALILASALLLPIFKSSLAESSANDTAQWVFAGDVARAPALISTLENSLPFGTEIMPYPGAGYVYYALLFVPRSVAPFKGHSTEIYYTAQVSNGKPEDMNWILGIGPIDDTALSFGWISVPFVLFVWGGLFGTVDSHSSRYPIFIILRMSPIWFVGYGVAFLLHFMPIALFGLLCQFAFAKQIPQRQIVILSRVTHPIECPS